MGAADAGIENVFRQAYGQAVATLVRVFGDITLAEDAVQDAFVVAGDRWHRDGVPPNPAGWIITTARNRAIDIRRRETRGRELHEQSAPVARSYDDSPDEHETEDQSVQDDQLRLMFTCCHPALRMEHRVALTLRLLGGLSVPELARSFLVSETAMTKRLVRAKYKIKPAGIPYRVPDSAVLPDRLSSVLTVIYLIYNTGNDDPERSSLRTDALRLGRSLVELMPTEPEAAGLLALMLLNEARADTRSENGELVLLRDQDRANWDREMIDEGQAIVRTCIQNDRPGPFQLQAAIQAVHTDAASFEETDWQQVVTIYGHLYSMMPTPVVGLNRAIAVAESEGPEAGLAALDLVAPALEDYHLLHAARGAVLQRLGRAEDARLSYERAAMLATTERDRRFLSDQNDDLSKRAN